MRICDWSSDVCSSDLPKPWTPLLEEIKMIVEAAAGCTFNSALLNLYRGNRDSIGFHSDDEKELGIEPTIASVSFGHERTFILKPKFNRPRSEEHTSELKSLMRNSYAVFCLTKKN